MILKRAHIKNFRSLRDVKVSFERQTAILGGNGAGKSTILKALDKFYGASSSVSVEDCFGRNLDEPVEIGLTFTDFSEAERKTFASHIVDEELSVLRVFDVRGGKSSGRYYGFIKGHAPFSSIRNAESANPKRAAYKDLRESGNAIYADLPAVGRAEDIELQLVQWELRHEDECTMVRDDGQFLGFANVAKGSLSKSTSFVLIPAVRDAAADAIDGRGSPISQLMELVVKSAIQRRKDFQDWQERASEEYRQLVNPDNLTELKALADTLTSSLRMLYEETAVSLDWRPASDFSVPLPTADVSLEDGGFPSTVEKQGNGLQRAFILTLLQHLARATMLSTQNADGQIVDAAESAGLEPVPGAIPDLKGIPERQALLPGLILAIEEPELYQHPTKQRHFARVLGLLSDGSLPGVATQMQVVFASHSPYFVCVDRFDEVRLARRHPIPQVTHKECVLRESSLRHVCSLLEVAQGKAAGTYSEDGLRARLHILTPELAEGFFADVVVLVEGESDRAAIKAIASVKGVDLEAQGIAVLSANGKHNLDRPAAIFQSLDIPVYAIWDCDRKGEKIDGETANRALQRLLGSPEAEVVGAGSRITDSFACFESELEATLKNELGSDALAASLTSAMDEFSVVRHEDAIKAPAIMSQTLSLLAKQGLVSQSLEAILGKILAKKSPIVPHVGR
jgi:putative ATP-dependent endonuclease of OLD family